MNSTEEKTKKKHSQKRVRDTKYNVYLTAAEKTEAHQIAASKGLTLADLIRTSIFTATNNEGGAE